MDLVSGPKLLIVDQPELSIPLEWEEILPTGTPTQMAWKLPLMFKYGNNTVMYLWQIGFNGMRLYVMHGPAETTTVVSKEVKTNTSGRSLQEQALLNARAKYKNMFFNGYVQVGSTDTRMIKGMKGYPYKPGVMKGKAWLASPKLNGIRLLCQHKGGNVMETRTYLNRVYKHFTLIVEQLIKLSVYMDGLITYDGELYKHGMEFYDISSAVKTQNYDHPQLPLINYCIFDYWSEENPHAEERYKRLCAAYQQLVSDGETLPNITIVPQILINTEEQAIALKNYYVDLGFEGLVIRRAAGNSPVGSRDFDMSKYKHGRSTRLYKIKDFIDEEAEVIGVISAEGKEEGQALLVIKDDQGIVTNIRFGQAEERMSWFQNPALVVGKKFTFKYFERGPLGAPIQPTGVGFRDYE